MGVFDLVGDGSEEPSEVRARASIEQIRVLPSRWGAGSDQREVELGLRANEPGSGLLEQVTGSLSALATEQLYTGMYIPVWVSPKTRSIVTINWEHLQGELEKRAPRSRPAPEATAEAQVEAQASAQSQPEKPGGVLGWRKRRRDRG